MTAPEILVVILSICLAIFLVISIILGILLIRVTLQIKRVTTTAEKAANNLEHMAETASKNASGAFLGRLVLKKLSKLRKK